MCMARRAGALKSLSLLAALCCSLPGAAFLIPSKPFIPPAVQSCRGGEDLPSVSAPARTERAATRVWSTPVAGQDSGVKGSSNGLKRRYSSWTWRGHTCNYRVEGDPKDPPLLLIHGFGASVNHFRNQFSFFPTQGYRVYSLDMLGYGASSKPEDVEYELELWRDQLVDFMQEVDPEGEWVVGGNSIGGLLSLMVTQARPEQVRGVVLFNSAGGLTSFRDEELPWYFRPIWIFVRVVLFGDMLGPGLFERFRTEENVRQILSQVYGNKTAVDDELVNILMEPGQDDGAQQVFLKILRAPAGPSPESILPTIRQPIIAIWGEDDPWTPLRTGLHPGVKFEQYNPSLQLFTLAETGHCPMDERPGQVHDIMLPFLDKVFQGSKYRPAAKQPAA